jgi:hypothetical protein
VGDTGIGNLQWFTKPPGKLIVLDRLLRNLQSSLKCTSLDIPFRPFSPASLEKFSLFASAHLPNLVLLKPACDALHCIFTKQIARIRAIGHLRSSREKVRGKFNPHRLLMNDRGLALSWAKQENW